MSEIYVGVKFQHFKLGETFEITENLSKLKKSCAVFFEKNLAPPYPGGSSGNLSFRLKPGGNKFVITAGHTALRHNMPDSDFCLVENYDLEQNIVKFFGNRIPSSESMMHGEIYRLRPDVNFVLHGHSDEILKFAEKNNLPTTAQEAEYGTKAMAAGLTEILGNNNFLIMKNHGFISLGKTIFEAEINIFDVLNNLLIC